MSMSLMRYDAARTALAECHRIDDAKDIADKALALQAYARQARDPDMERWVAEIRLRARRKVGELSSALESGAGRNLPNVPNLEQPSKSEALEAAGLSRTEAHRCEQLARVPEAAFESYIAVKSAEGKTVTADEVSRMVVKRERKDAVTTIAEAATVKTADLSALSSRGMKFGTVLADPPWLYGNQSTRGATGDHYTGMTVDEIAALPIVELAADNAHLHLWTTNAFLFESKRIMEAWGFEYRSCYVWVKPQIGMGNYWRVSHEFMLFGIRGSCPFADRSLRSWGEFSRGKHSAKPDQIRTLIEKASPGPRLELFGRRPAPGWVVWGNEIERTVFDAGVEELVA
jgi:N6-adenosine-specific RNA methylase IME4